MNKSYILRLCLCFNILTPPWLLTNFNTPGSKNISNEIPRIQASAMYIKIKSSSIQPTKDDKLDCHDNHQPQIYLKPLYDQVDHQSVHAIIAMKKKQDCNKRLMRLCTIFCYPCIFCCS